MRFFAPVRHRHTHASRRALPAAVAALALVLAACQQPAAAPTSAPAAPPTQAAKPAPAPTTAKPAAASPAAASPASSPVAAKPAASPAGSPAAAPASKPSVPAGTRLSIATGGTGGVYFPLGGGLAALLQKYLGVQATAEVTPASVDNMKLINERKTDLVAFSLADTAYDASQGRERLKDTGPIAVRSLGIIYANFMHLVTIEGSGINTPADLKGKRVSVGAAGSGTEIKANRVLEAYGLNPASDIRRDRLGVAESAGAIKDRKLDAFFWDGGLPTGAITDLANTPGITLKLIPHGDAVAKMRDKYGPFYTQVPIPKGTYKGVDQDVMVAGTPNILAVHEQFPEEVAYAILRTIADNRSEWDAIHPEAKNFNIETASAENPVPLHPGAIRFYRERGVYKGS